MTKVQNPHVIYEDNQDVILLAKNRQVGIHTKHIDISHHFLGDMEEEKGINIQYIQREDNPADIMNENTTEADLETNMKSITEGELWELMDTGRKNVKNTGVTDDVIAREKTEYSIHTLAKVVDVKKGMNKSLLHDTVLISHEYTNIDRGKKRIKDIN